MRKKPDLIDRLCAAYVRAIHRAKWTGSHDPKPWQNTPTVTDPVLLAKLTTFT